MSNDQRLRAGLQRQLTRVEFESQAKTAHRRRYVYDRRGCRRYVNKSTPIRAWCPVHQTYFDVYPNNHLDWQRRSRCRACWRQTTRRRAAFVYVLADPRANYCNFGYSSNRNWPSRLKEHCDADRASYSLVRKQRLASARQAADFEGYLIGLCYMLGFVPISGRCEVFQMSSAMGTAIFDLVAARWEAGLRGTGLEFRRDAKATLGAIHRLHFKR